MKSIFGFISLVVVSSFTLCLKEPINFEYKYKAASKDAVLFYYIQYVQR